MIICNQIKNYKFILLKEIIKLYKQQSLSLTYIAQWSTHAITIDTYVNNEIKVKNIVRLSTIFMILLLFGSF